MTDSPSIGTTKIVPRIFGGLGNQLFCYAAARRLALVNKAELVIDDSGFVRDHAYQRQNQLDHFCIQCRKATPAERLEPFSRARRYLKRRLSQRLPFEARSYICQEGMEFDPRLLQAKPCGTVYLEGYWQSESYFKDVEQTIRDDLRIIPPVDALNQRMAEEIRNSNAVALHVRWFDAPGHTATHNISADYYRRAMALMERKINSPRYFLFSDDPAAARAKLVLPEDRVTFVAHNYGDEYAYADLWLMSQCRHFITANSTFSWWGAWLGASQGKVVATPDLKIDGKAAWGFKGLIPNEWVRV